MVSVKKESAEIKQLAFFHYAVRNPFRSRCFGRKNFDGRLRQRRSAWMSLACEIWRALLEVSETKIIEHDDLRNGPGATPLRTACAQGEGHLFVYGAPGCGLAGRVCFQKRAITDLKARQNCTTFVWSVSFLH
jgi:hypothetical protein